MYNVVLVSGVYHSDSDTHTQILFHILFHNGLLQNIEYSSCAVYTVGSCSLSILYTAVCVPANPKLLIHTSPIFFPLW